jgi:hypothetical protein
LFVFVLLSFGNNDAVMVLPGKMAAQIGRRKRDETAFLRICRVPNQRMPASAVAIVHNRAMSERLEAVNQSCILGPDWPTIR